MASKMPTGVREVTTKGGEVRYQARLRDHNGRSISRNFARQSDAKRWRASEQSRVQRILGGLEEVPTSAPVRRELFTVAVETQAWLDAKTDITDRTRRDYQHLIDTLIVQTAVRRGEQAPRGATPLGDLSAADVTAADIHGFIRDLYGRCRFSQSRVKQTWQVLSATFSSLQAAELRDTDPCELARRRWRGLLKAPGKTQTEQEVMEPLTVGEMFKIADAAPERFRVMFRLIAATGMRIGEALAVQRQDVNPLKGTVTLRRALTRVSSTKTPGLIRGMKLETPKSGKSRTITLAPDVMADLEQVMANDPASPDTWLFRRASDGQPYTYQDAYDGFKQACERIGLEGRGLHDLRRGLATALFQQGLDAKSVGLILGHSDSSVASVTMKYVQASQSAADQALLSLGKTRVIAVR